MTSWAEPSHNEHIHCEPVKIIIGGSGMERWVLLGPKQPQKYPVITLSKSFLTNNYMRDIEQSYFFCAAGDVVVSDIPYLSVD